MCSSTITCLPGKSRQHKQKKIWSALSWGSWGWSHTTEEIYAASSRPCPWEMLCSHTVQHQQHTTLLLLMLRKTSFFIKEFYYPRHVSSLNLFPALFSEDKSHGSALSQAWWLLCSQCFKAVWPSVFLPAALEINVWPTTPGHELQQGNLLSLFTKKGKDLALCQEETSFYIAGIS